MTRVDLLWRKQLSGRKLEELGVADSSVVPNGPNAVSHRPVVSQDLRVAPILLDDSESLRTKSVDVRAIWCRLG